MVNESFRRSRSICQHNTHRIVALEVSGLFMNIQWFELNGKKLDRDQGSQDMVLGAIYGR